MCDSKPVRQDLLDELVWREVVKLLESPQLIQEELEQAVDRSAQCESLRGTVKTPCNASSRASKKSADRSDDRPIKRTCCRWMICDVECLSFKREQAIGGELSAIQSQLADRAGYLRLAETITSFACAATRDHEDVRCFRAPTHRPTPRGKEILPVSNDAIVIRHAIPAPTGSPAGGRPTSPTGGGRPSVGDPSYLLRTRSSRRCWRTYSCITRSARGWRRTFAHIHVRAIRGRQVCHERPTQGGAMLCKRWR